MEETMNLTAERSLEIITEQIERSRKSVSEDVGMTLLISGLCHHCKHWRPAHPQLGVLSALHAHTYIYMGYRAPC